MLTQEQLREYISRTLAFLSQLVFLGWMIWLTLLAILFALIF